MSDRLKISALVGVLFLATVTPFQASAQLDAAQQVQGETDDAGQEAQRRVNALDKAAQEAFWEYRQLTSELKVKKQYNDQLRKRVASQEEKIASLKGQIEEIEETRQHIVPLMDTMLTTLASFVDSDKPFKQAERRRRVQEARDKLNAADSSTGERFRRILNAYQQEVEYGRNIGAYRGELELDGEPRTVEFLRIGRVALLYQTPNRERQGFWHPQQNQWVALDDRYGDPIRRGLRIAKERTAPKMIRVPMVRSGGSQ